MEEDGYLLLDDPAVLAAVDAAIAANQAEEDHVIIAAIAAAIALAGTDPDTADTDADRIFGQILALAAQQDAEAAAAAGPGADAGVAAPAGGGAGGAGPGAVAGAAPGAAPAPPLVAPPAFLLGELATLPTADFRNGAAEAIVPLARAASLDVAFHLVRLPVLGALAAGVRPDINGIRAACIRAQYVQYATNAIPAVRAAGTVAARNAAAAANPDAAAVAYIVGTARCSAMLNYRIQDNEYLPNEISALDLYCVDGADGAVKVHPDAAAADVALANSLAEPTPAWVDLMSAVYIMAVGAVPQAGKVLFESKHHWLSSDTRRTTAIENQVLRAGPGKALFDTRKAQFQTWLWHHSIHVFAPQVLIAVATDDSTPARLEAADLGSAAVGLPAHESVMRAATTMVSCVDMIRVTLRESGHSADVPELQAAIIACQALAVGTPARVKAIHDVLKPAIKKEGSIVAWTFGYMTDYLSEAGINANTADGSMLAAYSLRNLKSQYPTAFASGVKRANNDKKVERRNIDNDKVVHVKL